MGTRPRVSSFRIMILLHTYRKTISCTQGKNIHASTAVLNLSIVFDHVPILDLIFIKNKNLSTCRGKLVGILSPGVASMFWSTSWCFQGNMLGLPDVNIK